MDCFDMKQYFDIDYTKKYLKECMITGVESELCIKLNGNDYMIIPFKDKISFQWIGKTKEFFYTDIDELFSSILVNQINLNTDWFKIEKIYFWDYDF